MSVLIAAGLIAAVLLGLAGVIPVWIAWTILAVIAVVFVAALWVVVVLAVTGAREVEEFNRAAQEYIRGYSE